MGATVNSVQLELYIDSSWGAMPDQNGLYMVSAGWDEMTVTQNTMPGSYNEPETLYSAPMVGSWLVLDVTDYVDYWLAGTRNNYGFMIVSWSMDYGGYYINSRESSSNKPKLILDYSGSNVEEASWGAIKALDE